MMNKTKSVRRRHSAQRMINIPTQKDRFFSSLCVPVWLVMKEVSVSSVLSVWLKRAMGLAPWKSRMLGTATVPNLVERLVEDVNGRHIGFTVNIVFLLTYAANLINRVIKTNICVRGGFAFFNGELTEPVVRNDAVLSRLCL